MVQDPSISQFVFLLVLLGQQSRVKGHKLGQEDRVRDFQRELQSDLYKDADTRHRDMLITLRVGVAPAM